MTEPVFILGAPRSGTTFLSSLLDSTSYGAPFETQFFTKYFKKLDNYNDLNDLMNFSRLVKNILDERAVMQWKLDIDISSFFEEFNGDVTYSKLVDKLCLKAAAKKGLTSWGDKTPHYLTDIEIIYEMFPDSKYIYIVRDGRDVALSLLKKGWGPNNIFTSAKYWVELNKENDCLDEIKRKGNLLFLKYEDLLDNVELYVNNIYEFLEATIDKETQRQYSHRVLKENYNKWKTMLSDSQIKVFESVAADTLNRFDYKVVNGRGKIPYILTLAYIFHDKVLLFKHLFKLNVIDTIKIKYFGKEPFAE
jgi:hypothetical protein